MSRGRLDVIVSSVRAELETRKAAVPFGDVVRRARQRGPARSLVRRLRSSGGIIAEIKRASPSRGWIRRDLDAAGAAAEYARGGACGISVLTEGRFFGGSLEDLEQACAASGEVPVLRKDFLLDEYMVAESRARGADVVLLIAAVLGDRVGEMLGAAERFGLEALVEVHDEAEMGLAAASGAALIGINNRDLESFAVDLNTARRLLPVAPRDALKVVESGISTAEEITEFRALGASGFLVGESLLQADDSARAIGRLLGWVGPAADR